MDMNRSARGKRLISFTLLALSLSVLLVLPILGCLGGGWYGTAWHRGTILAWQPLQPLPEKATEILAAGAGLSRNSWAVYVKTTDQKIYSCSPEACWLEKTVVPEDLRANPPCDPPVHFEAPAPPGPVVDSREAQTCNSEAGYQVNFVVLEDGRVWRWQHYTTAFSRLERLFVSTVCGSILGLSGGIGITGFIWLRHKRKKDDSNE
jgi:hypothetical protein